MAYIGNNLQVAYQSYTNIDDISGSFNGSTTSFALLVNGAAPVPLPLSSNQCLISVGGVIQRPDDSGTEGFRLSGGNIIFSSAPTTGEDFFGVILAGADYVNAGANFPDGTVGAPSITFDQDTDTGLFRSGSGAVAYTSNATKTFTFPTATGSSGQYLQTDGAGTTTWASVASDAISEGNTSAEVIDTGSDGRFVVTTEGSERARIDSSGRLLVGTSTTISNNWAGTGSSFQIAKNDYFSAGLFSFTSVAADAYCPYLDIHRARGTQASPTVVASGDDLGEINFYGHDGTTFIRAGSIRSYVDGTPGANDMPGRLVFSVTKDSSSSPTERLRLANNGEFTNYSDSYCLAARSGTGAGTTVTLFYGARNATSVASGTGVIEIYTNGDIKNTNGSYTSLSDQRLKENIVDASSQWSDIKGLQIRNFNFREDTGHETHKQLGLIAQEVELVCPGLVKAAPVREEEDVFDADGNRLDEVKSVNISVLYMKAVKALQEAMERIETLEAEVAALKAQ